jgi:hypothetical protein
MARSTRDSDVKGPNVSQMAIFLVCALLRIRRKTAYHNLLAPQEARGGFDLR